MKGKGTIFKAIAIELARYNKLQFQKSISSPIKEVINNNLLRVFNYSLVSFSSSKDFYEQVLSIITFLRNAGIPKKWTIYSDGSHSKQQIAFLEEHFSFVEVRIHDIVNLSFKVKASLQPYLEDILLYASKYPLGKKLFYFLNHPIEEPVIFLDSDILFYKNAQCLNSICCKLINGAFLPEWIWGTLDEFYLKTHTWQMYQVNSGFFVLCNELKVTEGLEYLKSLKGNFQYFSEQTTFHILFESNNLTPLDPRIFFLDNSDQFWLNYNFNKDNILLRHYTGPVRHKMWQRNYKWHLSL